MTLLELLPFALVLLAVWLLLLRPAKARRAAHDALVSSLGPGVRIMTTAGVFGTVRTVDEERMELEIAPGVVIEMVPQAVGRIIEPADAEPDPSGAFGELEGSRTEADAAPEGGGSDTGTGEASRG